VIRDIETLDTLERELKQEAHPVFLYFFAPWCSICHAYSFKMEQFSMKYPHIKVIKVDISKAEHISLTYKVLHVPSIVVIKELEIIHRFSTVVPIRELEKILNA
jgi:thioredoxin 1